MWALSLFLSFVLLSFSDEKPDVPFCVILDNVVGRGRELIFLGISHTLNLGQSIFFILFHFSLRIHSGEFVLFWFIEENTEPANLNTTIEFTLISSGVRNWDFSCTSPLTAKHKCFLWWMPGRSQTKFLEQPLKECLSSYSALKFLSDIQANCTAYFYYPVKCSSSFIFLPLNLRSKKQQHHEFLSVKVL